MDRSLELSFFAGSGPRSLTTRHHEKYVRTILLATVSSWVVGSALSIVLTSHVVGFSNLGGWVQKSAKVRYLQLCLLMDMA